MIVCSDCFSDAEIKTRIESYGKKGTCQFCGKTECYIYDSNKDSYLSGIFDKIINLYSPVSSLSKKVPASKQTFLKSEFSKSWGFFNKLSEEQIYNILVELSSDLYSETPELFDSPIINAQIDDTTSITENSILRGYEWNDFVFSLKHQNRFHTGYMNTEIFEKFCSYIRKPYKKGTKFYRARISSEKGFEPIDMGAPKADIVSDGRANSAGIRRLYLADDFLTTIYETRAGAFDFVSVGCFELQKDITVVDFKLINQISPVTEGLSALQYIINRDLLNKINDEMGKTMRRSDSVLDYLPTQYITDFIQSISYEDGPEYDGIEYRSTLHPAGYNLAIFNPELFKCISVDVYRVNEIKYDPMKI